MVITLSVWSRRVLPHNDTTWEYSRKLTCRTRISTTAGSELQEFFWVECSDWRSALTCSCHKNTGCLLPISLPANQSVVQMTTKANTVTVGVNSTPFAAFCSQPCSRHKIMETLFEAQWTEIALYHSWPHETSIRRVLQSPLKIRQCTDECLCDLWCSDPAHRTPTTVRKCWHICCIWR